MTAAADDARRQRRGRAVPGRRPDGRRAGRLGPAGPARGAGRLRRRAAGAAPPRAPIELTRIGKWLEHVPDAPPRRRPSRRRARSPPGSGVLAARRRRVLFVGATDGSIGGRIEAIRQTALGERRPHPGGHWLHALTGLETARVWWAATTAVEEYEDALLTAFADDDPGRRAGGAPRSVGRPAVRQPPDRDRRAEGDRPRELARRRPSRSGRRRHAGSSGGARRRRGRRRRAGRRARPAARSAAPPRPAGADAAAPAAARRRLRGPTAAQRAAGRPARRRDDLGVGRGPRATAGRARRADRRRSGPR